MFDFRSSPVPGLSFPGFVPLLLAPLFLVPGCAGGRAGPGAIDRTIAEEVREGRREGYPDLAAIRVPEGKRPSTASIVAALEDLEEEAEVLRLLRAAAVRAPNTTPLENERDALASEIEALRESLAARPPVDRGPF